MLSLDSLAALAEIVGAVAVVLSLVYVGYQVQQNTKAIRTQVHETLVGHVFESEGSLLANADLARIVVKSWSDPESLSPDERLRADTFFTFEFVNWESAFLHYRQGWIDQQVWRRWDISSRPDEESPGYFDFWLRNRHWFEDNFVGHVDRVFSELGFSDSAADSDA